VVDTDWIGPGGRDLFDRLSILINRYLRSRLIRSKVSIERGPMMALLYPTQKLAVDLCSILIPRYLFLDTYSSILIPRYLFLDTYSSILIPRYLFLDSWIAVIIIRSVVDTDYFALIRSPIGGFDRDFFAGSLDTYWIYGCSIVGFDLWIGARYLLGTLWISDRGLVPGGATWGSYIPKREEGIGGPAAQFFCLRVL
jgi:hypothetical protein